jgi:hypothetical protein
MTLKAASTMTRQRRRYANIVQGAKQPKGRRYSAHQSEELTRSNARRWTLSKRGQKEGAFREKVRAAPQAARVGLGSSRLMSGALSCQLE